MLIGEKIKYLREKENMTQRMLARSAGIGQTLISNYENGYYTTIGPKTVKKLAHALNVNKNYLMNDEGDVTAMERIKEETILIGNGLKELREKSGLFQKDVAKLLEISTGHYNRIETGKVDIRKATQTATKEKLIELFPEFEVVIRRIDEPTAPIVTDIYDPNGIYKEVALDSNKEEKPKTFNYQEFKNDHKYDKTKEDAMMLSEAAARGVSNQNLSEPVKININNNDDLTVTMPEDIARRAELGELLILAGYNYSTNPRDLALLNLYNKGDYEGLKKLATASNDFGGDY